VVRRARGVPAGPDRGFGGGVRAPGGPGVPGGPGPGDQKVQKGGDAKVWRSDRQGQAL